MLIKRRPNSKLCFLACALLVIVAGSTSAAESRGSAPPSVKGANTKAGKLFGLGVCQATSYCSGRYIRPKSFELSIGGDREANGRCERGGLTKQEAYSYVPSGRSHIRETRVLVQCKKCYGRCRIVQHRRYRRDEIARYLPKHLERFAEKARSFASPPPRAYGDPKHAHGTSEKSRIAFTRPSEPSVARPVRALKIAGNRVFIKRYAP